VAANETVQSILTANKALLETK